MADKFRASARNQRRGAGSLSWNNTSADQVALDYPTDIRSIYDTSDAQDERKAQRAADAPANRRRAAQRRAALRHCSKSVSDLIAERNAAKRANCITVELPR